MKKVAVVAYIPVIHQGYMEFLKRNLPADIFLLTPSFIKTIDFTIGDRLTRDIRAVNVGHIKLFLETITSNKVEILSDLQTLDDYSEIRMPDEDISINIRNMISSTVRLDTIFLRWDWNNTTIPKSVEGNFRIVSDEESRTFMAFAVMHSEKSSDVWRQVGAVLPYKEGSMYCAFNEHKPTPSAPYIHGDPRLNMKPGEKPEICGALHAEKSIVAQAARTLLQGTSIYVTTFPCSDCARVLVEAGVKRVFFKEGYSVLDAAEILLHANVEVFQVK
jgi:dCMP deaminase